MVSSKIKDNLRKANFAPLVATCGKADTKLNPLSASQDQAVITNKVLLSPKLHLSKTIIKLRKSFGNLYNCNPAHQQHQLLISHSKRR